MINMRGIPKKMVQPPQSQRSNIRHSEKPNYSPEVDRSLLIHDDASEIFSDQSSSLKEINDKDIPLEKRNIINDPTYFKQLSLSFYGTPPSAPRSLSKNENNQYNFKASPKLESPKLDHSLSPRSSETYYYGFKKPLNSPFERDPFMRMTVSSTKNIQNSQISLSNSKININQIRDLKMEKFEPESPKVIASPTDMSKYKAFRVNLNNILTTQVKNGHGLDAYSQFSTGQTTLSATTPRQNNIFSKAAGKEIGSPRVKKIINTKTKGVTKDYLLTEPNTILKSPIKYNQIPKKLQMYAMDNLSMTNFKNAMGADGKTPVNKTNITDKTPARPTISKGLQGIVNRNGPLTNRKVAKNSSYYD